MATISPLRQRMIEDMKIRNLSPATQQSYIYAVAKFSRHFGCPPDQLRLEQVRSYQLHLIRQKHSWSHVNQVACALRFFYEITLGQTEAFERIVGGQKPEGALTPIPVFGPKPLQVGEQDRLKFAQSAGANSISELRAKPANELLDASINNPSTYAFGVVDGYVVPEHPASVYSHGKQNDVASAVVRSSSHSARSCRLMKRSKSRQRGTLASSGRSLSAAKKWITQCPYQVTLSSFSMPFMGSLPTPSIANGRGGAFRVRGMADAANDTRRVVC